MSSLLVRNITQSRSELTANSEALQSVIQGYQWLRISDNQISFTGTWSASQRVFKVIVKGDRIKRTTVCKLTQGEASIISYSIFEIEE
jgi:hypothetical protein